MSNSKHIAIVTGASGNLGKAVIKKFIAEGYFVIGTRHHTDISFDDSNFESIEADLTNEEAASAFVNDVIARHKHIDVAILTTGGFAMGNIGSTKTSDIANQYKLNFETTYNVAAPVFNHMLQQNNGKIFMIGSKPGLDMRNGKGMVAYSLAKSLIFRLAELMNDEARGKNVVTNVIVPGTIDTPQNRAAMPGSSFDKWTTPEAIADVIYWYCTSEANVLREGVIKIYNQA
ncbi:SDR family NAD(P)-dependent oxidoreductase [Parafilimonas terrae]|uniref:NADP-dependent 3-hydroxy acid dehydrogenase YdfG n=1 Tax=Parafilimonas terrae TaxID=1465490 RepID=A0A1I5U8W0_9BACT|nr:SDR family NAD(P)-dependent oxidoreductase [Parafilimonas terrae]SFP91694.1 NADP-dependent 3-hydroxy acid dehydrogenase YdfG [Parafilimonas terrae]